MTASPYKGILFAKFNICPEIVEASLEGKSWSKYLYKSLKFFSPFVKIKPSLFFLNSSSGASISSTISPTISSRISSKVTMPRNSPYSSIIIEKCSFLFLNYINWLAKDDDSGINHGFWQKFFMTLTGENSEKMGKKREKKTRKNAHFLTLRE